MCQHSPHEFQNDGEWSTENIVGFLLAPASKSSLVVKEREMEIGYPTDVKHVAHIGWDGPSGTGPSWMNDFKTAPDFSTSLGNLGELSDPNAMGATTSWSSQDFEESTGSQSSSNIYKGIQSAGASHVSKKSKKKKSKSASSESLSASSRQSRSTKSKTIYSDREATPISQN
ncbi:hypothetical protein LR48_Vigan02g229600 [Vigna angularis]|uniref:CRIB domain-containing protein n=1 Tax=Phaseolus angularis TaxID=3914 RepID=A0A0L9U064_PHAAN|nr:hypothetical protein LR48_Vigan02g229600 [Vigna angularis]